MRGEEGEKEREREREKERERDIYIYIYKCLETDDPFHVPSFVHDLESQSGLVACGLQTRIRVWSLGST